LRVVNNFVLMN